MAVTHETSWLGEGPVAESFENFRRIRKQNGHYERRTHRHVQCWTRRVVRAQFQTNYTLWFCELPDSAALEPYASTSHSDPHGSKRLAWVIVPDKFIGHNTIMVSNAKPIMPRPLAILWVETFPIFVGPIRIPLISVATS